ncbi:MAG: sigma-54-dependent Fis family transcriptional regulator, partial [Deltaproteobacteria bacterium]|nr:sigma-54-dependent Fis family transcriptional regulator [Deltaproteobacteria bacterium]
MTTLGTIVVADDEVLARQSVAEVLQEEGYQVYQAADGQTALKILEDVDVDLILSDLRMPVADGLAVLKKVRDVYPQTMVILMTAYASVETVVEALRLGAQDYLLKPVLFDDLLHKVRHLLEHKRQAWEIQLLRREITRHFDFDGIVGRSPAMKEIFALTKKV